MASRYYSSSLGHSFRRWVRTVTDSCSGACMLTSLTPAAVAARFGIGKDFFINVVLTICGYIPGE